MRKLCMGAVQTILCLPWKCVCMCVCVCVCVRVCVFVVHECMHMRSEFIGECWWRVDCFIVISYTASPWTMYMVMRDHMQCTMRYNLASYKWITLLPISPFTWEPWSGLWLNFGVHTHTQDIQTWSGLKATLHSYQSWHWTGCKHLHHIYLYNDVCLRL